MRTFIILLTLALPMSANAEIKISSLTDGNTPKIIIRSQYDFEEQISLKVRQDPRFTPSDILLKTISEMGMVDANGVKITSGFDVDVQNDVVLAYSGGVSEIIRSQNNPNGLSIVASFKDANGNFVSPSSDQLAIYNTGGDKLAFEYAKVSKTPPKMAFVLLLDRSGSMGEVIGDVRSSAQDFLSALPAKSQCAVASFNGSYSYHNKYFEDCNTGDFSLDTIEAGGKTDLYSPLLSAYENLSQDYFKDYQKAVIVITDGRIPPDEELKNKLRAAQKDILTFVYFLGDKSDQQLVGLANGFLAGSSNIKESLGQYFSSLSSAYNYQKILRVTKSDGGSYAQ